jgi:hypothetical protein
MLNTNWSPAEIWYSSEALSSAYVELAKRYSFDGILVNLPGRPRNWRAHIAGTSTSEGSSRLDWDTGGYSIVQRGDNVHYFGNPRPSLEVIDPGTLFYVEPENITGIKYPFFYDFGEYVPSSDRNSLFPPYLLETLRLTLEKAGEDIHVSSEVFSPFTQFMELLGYSEALMALVDDSKKCLRILDSLADGAAALAKMQIEAGTDAVLVSSAFAGGGFISPDYYRSFVLPFEKRVVDMVHANSDVPVYVHTCGKIADRIDFIRSAGYDGIDTMDPPPIGNCDIVSIKEEFGKDLFLKGNIDPINIVLNGSPDSVYEQSVRLIERLGRRSGYILSTACSVPPGASPKNIVVMSKASFDVGMVY